jgi:hypothetical protein
MCNTFCVIEFIDKLWIKFDDGKIKPLEGLVLFALCSGGKIWKTNLSRP